MWLAYVFTDYVATPFFNLLFLTNNSNTPTTWACCRFHYVHTFELTYFSVYAPSFVIIRKYVCHRSYIKSFTIKSPHPLNILPHKIFSTNAPTSSKVVCMLKLIYSLNAIYFKKTSPQNIPLISWCYKVKASHF